jgi:hypothetical protein
MEKVIDKVIQVNGIEVDCYIVGIYDGDDYPGELHVHRIELHGVEFNLNQLRYLEHPVWDYFAEFFNIKTQTRIKH